MMGQIKPNKIEVDKVVVDVMQAEIGKLHSRLELLAATRDSLTSELVTVELNIKLKEQELQSLYNHTLQLSYK